MHRPFNRRGFVTLATALLGVGLSATGLANHIFEEDSTGTAPHLWMSIHSALGILFIVFATWHALQNRRTLLNYARDLAVRRFPVSLEAISALLLISALLVLAAMSAFLEE